MIEASFYIGQIIYHQRFNYRGVIIGVDAQYNNSEQWYETMAITKPPKDKPWYSVLVDKSMNMTYVAQRNLGASENTSQIEHPLLGSYFNKYDGERYFVKQRVN